MVLVVDVLIVINDHIAAVGELALTWLVTRQLTWQLITTVLLLLQQICPILLLQSWLEIVHHAHVCCDRVCGKLIL